MTFFFVVVYVDVDLVVWISRMMVMSARHMDVNLKRWYTSVGIRVAVLELCGSVIAIAQMLQTKKMVGSS